ncbi:MAG: acyltransferase family protein [bacterium]
MAVSKSIYQDRPRRYSWLDYDKGISIILVSFRHCYESLVNTGLDVASYPMLEYINVFLFGFRMPLFFIASGIFFSSSLAKKGLGLYTKVRVQNILYPMLVWGTIQLTLQLVFSAYTNVEYGLKEYFSLIIDPRRTGQFWYLNALFFVGILYSVLRVKVNFNTRMQLLLGVLMFFAVGILRRQDIYLGFLMDILQYYLFFAIGDFLAILIKSERSTKFLSSFRLLFFLIPIFIFIQYFFTDINMFHDNNYYVEHKMPLFFLLVAFVGCLLSINIAFILSRFNIASSLSVIGYHSIYIFCMQIIIMAGVRIILVKIFMITFVPLLILILLFSGIIFPILAYKLFVQLNMKWMFSISHPQSA